MAVRALVVDDSRMIRRAIVRLLASDPEIEVVGEAGDGEEALALVERLQPDVMTLDVEMPRLSGLEVLDRLGPGARVRVIMLSSLTREGSETALEAMRRGAADFVTKEASGRGLHIEEIRRKLLPTLKAVARSGRRAPSGGSSRRTSPPPKSIDTPSTGGARAGAPAGSAPAPARLQFRPGLFDVVLIGSSTGGPPVLEKILKVLPPDLSAAVVIAQHMPEMFTRSMTHRLEQECAVTVTHGEDGMPLYPGAVYIVPGGKHGRVHRGRTGKWTLEVSEEPVDAPYKPSVNELLHSGAKAAGSRCLGVVLTGMGEDGARGARALRESGGLILTQDAESCVVYGMPRAVVEGGDSEISLPPDQIGALLRLLGTAGPIGARPSGAARPAA